jgi:hypothetical protein
VSALVLQFNPNRPRAARLEARSELTRPDRSISISLTRKLRRLAAEKPTILNELERVVDLLLRKK